MSLVPADLDQCQAEKPNGANFMTLGGRPQLVRCRNKPTTVATERVAGSDGQRGSMSLCDDCQPVLLRQCGPDYADFTPIQLETL